MTCNLFWDDRKGNPSAFKNYLRYFANFVNGDLHCAIRNLIFNFTTCGANVRFQQRRDE
jgi:hypothetical protein